MEENIRLCLENDDQILNHQGRTLELSEEMASEMRVLLDISNNGGENSSGCSDGDAAATKRMIVFFLIFDRQWRLTAMFRASELQGFVVLAWVVVTQILFRNLSAGCLGLSAPTILSV
jgi:hypothetical protein